MSARRMSTLTRSAELPMSAISASARAPSKSPRTNASSERSSRTLAVLYWQEPGQLLGFGPVAQDDQHAREAGAELLDAHVRP